MQIATTPHIKTEGGVQIEGIGEGEEYDQNGFKFKNCLNNTKI